ncbi:class I SAM-dependent methyltransferase [Shewanella sp.]|uniref:class I SAM-dependent methyltransferase n=1 Tax=Shewanella sp. TaxID=50422 RepID=UPI003563240B
MKLNQTERAVVTSKGRAWLQTSLEAKLLLSLFSEGLPDVEDALEIGCGGGLGVSFLRERLGASNVTAMDLDGQMLAISAVRWQHAPWAHFAEADACFMPFADQRFDLVAEFAVFHHIPRWQDALAEVARVLRPGGQFLFWDLYRAAICNPISKRLFEHPMENRFNHREFVGVTRELGLRPIACRELLGLAGMGLFIKT